MSDPAKNKAVNDAKNDAVSYRDAGVDIDAGDEAVERIKHVAARTHIQGVMGGVGGFGGLFALKDALGTIDDPVLVSGTDGVGTKLLVAIAADRHGSVGQDLVAMCVNDILTTGARPLFFLDYYATGKLSPVHMADVVTGIARACEESGCALLGGETAELPGLYTGADYDLAGFAVGVVDRKRIIDGRSVTVGDAIIGLSSSGLHSNGYSLARKVLLDRMALSLAVPFDASSADRTVADVLLEPTRLYVKTVMALLDENFPVRAMAHITGGGIPGNLTRAFPDGLTAHVDTRRWREPAVFTRIRAGGPVVEDEMRKTFNMGIGFALVVPPGDVARTLTRLQALGEEAVHIGDVTLGTDVTYAGDAA
jgi:phosphoribosylformylglycinamidine cyclo-ligase